MDQLISRVVSQLGIDQDLASKAIGAILKLLQDQGDSGAVGTLLAKLPGAQDLLASAGGGGESSGGGGLLGGLTGAVGGALGGGGGGLLGSLGALAESGVDMDQVKSIAPMFMDFAKEHAGDELVDQAVGSVPGLSELL